MGNCRRRLAAAKLLFHSPEVGCAACHAGGLRTDLRSHDVGRAGRFDQGQTLFDTPALVELWRRLRSCTMARAPACAS